MSPAPLGEALGEVLRRDGVELMLGATAGAARRDGDDYVIALDDGREVRGDRLLVATGRRPRTAGIGLERCAVTDDGRACALEYNVVAWGRTELGRQAGLAVYVRGDSGKLAAARVYDDSDPPLSRSAQSLLRATSRR